jgi:hypothetical protein
MIVVEVLITIGIICVIGLAFYAGRKSKVTTNTGK